MHHGIAEAQCIFGRIPGRPPGVTSRRSSAHAKQHRQAITHRRKERRPRDHAVPVPGRAALEYAPGGTPPEKGSSEEPQHDAITSRCPHCAVASDAVRDRLFFRPENKAGCGRTHPMATGFRPLFDLWREGITVPICLLHAQPTILRVISRPSHTETSSLLQEDVILEQSTSSASFKSS